MSKAEKMLQRARGIAGHHFLLSGLICGLAVFLSGVASTNPAIAQDNLPWKSRSAQSDYEVYREQPGGSGVDGGGYETGRDGVPSYVPPRVQSYGSEDRDSGYGSNSAYNRGPDVGGSDRRYVPQRERAPAAPREYSPRYEDRADNSGYERYSPPGDERYDAPPRDGAYQAPPPQDGGSFSEDEILQTGHEFFGSISQGLAKVIEKAFNEQGRPNGYILGEDAGGAFIAGLRYGEGTLYTRDYGTRKVYWQGPTVGYDFGAEGSKTMVLVYNLRHPNEIFGRFGGVQGAAYVVGGVGLQVMQRDDVTLAPIRSGVGLRLGANVGYLKYTRSPTWNPF
ncbi:MAG: DUF1134 domain-containing protein [Filomicrobium sp.]